MALSEKDHLNERVAGGVASDPHDFIVDYDEKLGVVPHHKGISDGKITFPLQQAITCG